MLVFQSNASLSLMLPKLEKWNSKSLSLALSLENLQREKEPKKEGMIYKVSRATGYDGWL